MKESIRFCIDEKSYKRTALLITLFISAGILLVILAGMSITYIQRYFPVTSLFSWQILLTLAILYLICICIGECLLASRLFYMLRKGKTKSVIEIQDDAVKVRDVSYMNLGSIFWFGATSFGCFIVAMSGITPSLLLPDAVKNMHTTTGFILLGAIGLLAISGIVISIISMTFIIIGWIGSVSFTQRLGAMYVYPFTNESQILFRKKNILACAYANKSETIVDLQMMSSRDREKVHSILEKKAVIRQEQGDIQIRPTNILLKFIRRTKPLAGLAE